MMFRAKEHMDSAASVCFLTLVVSLRYTRKNYPKSHTNNHGFAWNVLAQEKGGFFIHSSIETK